MRRAFRGRRRYAAQAMSFEALERWIDRLAPPPLINGVSMLDGYLTAIIVGPCSIDPYEWMRHMLGPHSAIGSDGSEQFAAMQAIAARFEAVSDGLATAPQDHAPIFERTNEGIVHAGPWCMGLWPRWRSAATPGGPSAISGTTNTAAAADPAPLHRQRWTPPARTDAATTGR
jgi:uncharacterized protein